MGAGEVSDFLSDLASSIRFLRDSSAPVEVISPSSEFDEKPKTSSGVRACSGRGALSSPK